MYGRVLPGAEARRCASDHDVMLKQRDENVREELSRAINVNVGPLTEGS